MGDVKFLFDLTEALNPEGHMLKTLPLKEIKARLKEFFEGQES